MLHGSTGVSAMQSCLLRCASVCVLSAALVFLAGCALTNPYLNFEKDYGRESVPPSGAVPLDEAIKYARQTKGAYREALGDRAEFRNILGIGLIPLSATAIALGIDGGHSTAILVLGATGAAAYGMGTWLDSKPTERAYIAGYNAIGCALDAVEPFRIARTSDKDWTAFERGLDEIDSSIESVESLIGKTRGLVAGSGTALGAAQTEIASVSIQAATSVVANATTVRRNGVSLRREMNLTGTRLVAAVDRITGEVDMAVLRNQPDLQALSSIVNGLGQAFGQFAPVPESGKSAKDLAGGDAAGIEQAGVSDLPQVLSELRTAVASLSTSVREVGDFVNAVAAKKPVEALRRCGVDVESIAGDIGVNPDGPIELTVGTQSAVGRTIVGGRAPYRASVIGTAPGLVVIQPELFGPAFIVQSGEGLSKGEYSVLLADGAGRRMIVPVFVKEGLIGNGGGTENGLSARLSTQQIESVQKALCTETGKVDGIWGSNTQRLFDEFKKSEGAGSTDSELVDQLLEMTPEQVAERCKKEAPESDLQAFAEAIDGHDLGFEVGATQKVAFYIKSASVSADEKTVVVTLEYVSGDLPDQPISIDAVKSAIREADPSSGDLLSNEHITIADEEDVKKRLAKP